MSIIILTSNYTNETKKCIAQTNKGRKVDVSFEPCFEFFQGYMRSGLSIYLHEFIKYEQTLNFNEFYFFD